MRRWLALFLVAAAPLLVAADYLPMIHGPVLQPLDDWFNQTRKDVNNNFLLKDLRNLLPANESSVILAANYGSCIWDGSPAHDVAPCLTQALAYLAGLGGGRVVMPPGTFYIQTTVTVSDSNVALIGAGDGGPVGTGGSLRFGSAVGTTLKWNGPAGGRMMSIATNSGQIIGTSVTNMVFDGNNGLAADGLYLASVLKGHFDSLSFTGGFNGGTVLTCTAQNAAAGSSQENTFNDIWINNSTGGAYTSNGFLLDSLVDGAGAHGNCSGNHIRNVFAGGSAPTTSVICRGCDTNIIDGLTIFNAGTGLDLTIAVSGATLVPANGNIIRMSGGTASVVSRGTTSFPGCTEFISCPNANILEREMKNGEPAPVEETGTQLIWQSNSGYNVNSSFIGSAIRPTTFAYFLADWATCMTSGKGRHVAGYTCGIWQITPTTVGALPGCDAAGEGMMRPVSDANSVVFNAAVAAGGANHILAYCDGTSWKVH